MIIPLSDPAAGVIHRVRRLSLNNAILIWTREPVPIVWRAAEEAVSSAGIATYTSRRIVDSQLSKYSARAREARRPQAQDGSGPLMEELASTQDLTPDMKDSARSTADEGVSRPASFDQRREHDFRDPYFRPGTPRREV